jgi:hypothetical protein
MKQWCEVVQQRCYWEAFEKEEDCPPVGTVVRSLNLPGAFLAGMPLQTANRLQQSGPGKLFESVPMGASKLKSWQPLSLSCIKVSLSVSLVRSLAHLAVATSLHLHTLKETRHASPAANVPLGPQGSDWQPGL